MRGNDVAEADLLARHLESFPEANLRFTAEIGGFSLERHDLGHSCNVLYVRAYTICFRFHPKVQLGEPGRTLKDVHVRVLEFLFDGVFLPTSYSRTVKHIYNDSSWIPTRLR
jgi:hypothetical protein